MGFWSFEHKADVVQTRVDATPKTGTETDEELGALVTEAATAENTDMSGIEYTIEPDLRWPVVTAIPGYDPSGG